MVSPTSKLSGAFWRWGGKRRLSLQLRLWNLNSAFNSPLAPRRLSCQISVNQRKAGTSTNVNKHWKTRERSLLSLPISISHRISHRLFRCRYSNSRDVVASSPFFSRPAKRTPRRACSLASTAKVNCRSLQHGIVTSTGRGQNHDE